MNESAFSATLSDSTASKSPHAGSPAKTRSAYDAATHATDIPVLRYMCALSLLDRSFSLKYFETLFLSSLSKSVFGEKRIFVFACEAVPLSA